MSINQHHHRRITQTDNEKRLTELYQRVPKELGCAFAASFLVSPIVSIIDKAIVVEITGIQSLLQNMGQAGRQMINSPRTFFTGLSFRLTFGVYFGTYAVANLAETLLDHQQHSAQRDDATRTLYKVSAASAANVGLLAWRDSIFARTFSNSSSSRPTPFRTLALFAARDSATMAATFYAAPKLSQHLQAEYQWKKNKADVYSALSAPVAAQFLSAPLHIHALDFFARPQATTMDRLSTVRKELGKVCFARGLRVLPAFGLGSYSNSMLRDTFVSHHDAVVRRPVLRHRYTLARPLMNHN